MTSLKEVFKGVKGLWNYLKEGGSAKEIDEAQSVLATKLENIASIAKGMPANVQAALALTARFSSSTPATTWKDFGGALRRLCDTAEESAKGASAASPQDADAFGTLRYHADNFARWTEAMDPNLAAFLNVVKPPSPQHLAEMMPATVEMTIPANGLAAFKLPSLKA